jgi:maltooligosyltrehalose trehalohydrolase
MDAAGSSKSRSLGASRAASGDCAFKVWAPHAKCVEVILHQKNQSLVLAPEGHGYHFGLLSSQDPEVRYTFRLDGQKERADPASRYQPEGVFGPSQIADLSDSLWTDRGWRGLDLKNYVFYELHVGTYTKSGTLDEIVHSLPQLKSLGVTALELMPVAQFSGTRNWGYDGVFPFAVHNSYGGPHALQRLVNACHREGLAVVLDVVYNHLGPEGNFLNDFGPYFTDRYQTPWGQALNFDGPHSDEVIQYFIENALYWLDDLHIDALRLDAIHGIFDRSAQPFLSLLSSAVDNLAKRSNRKIHLIAESDLNDARFVRTRDRGGYGLHAQWNDDFHHALHGLQTKERFGYYCDFGSLDHMEKAYRNGYVYTGEYSEYRQRRHGNSSRGIRPSQLAVFSQNHDQVGNRMLGERSSTLLSLEAQKLSAGAVLLSPYLPLLFMGEEYGEPAPFLYFTSHTDPQLGKAVRDGRRAEFRAFFQDGEPPDPQAEETFLKSKLDLNLRTHGSHRVLWEFYRELLRLRKEERSLNELDHSLLDVRECQDTDCLLLHRTYEENETVVVLNFAEMAVDCAASFPPGKWRKLLDSADTLWRGPGSAMPDEFATPSPTTVKIQPKSLCLLKRTL